MAAPQRPEGLTLRHIVMLRSADASAPAIPAGLTATLGTGSVSLAWDASADPYVAPTGASGMKEYILTRDGVFLATVATTPGLSIELTGSDIGGFAPAGADSQGGASHTLTAAGNELYGTSDQFRFKAGLVTGDCTIYAQLAGFASSYEFSKAALMFRESLAANAAFVDCVSFPLTTGAGCILEYRASTGASAGQGALASVPPGARWLKLQRIGNLFRGFYSTGGGEWVLLGTQTVTLPTTCYAGLAVSSQNAGSPVTALFQNFAITNSPALAYLDSGGVASSVYRVAARDNAGNLSDYSAAASATSSGLALSSQFAGLNALVQTNIYTDGVERRFDGTDSVTGQVFSSTSPQAWGGQTTQPVIQFLGGTGRNPDTVWSTSFVTNAPGNRTALRVRRLLSHVQPSQAAYRIRTNAVWDTQGMYYCRKKLFIPSSFPTTATGFFVLDEIKVNGAGETEDRVAWIITRENFNGADRWLSQVSATWTNGTDVGTWNAGTPVTPAQDSFFQSRFYKQGAFADGTGLTIDSGRWITTEFACRLQDGSNRVAGNGARGWLYCAVSVGTATDPAANGTGTMRAYVEARNMTDNFAATAPSGNGIAFPFNFYSTLPIEGIDFYLHSLECYDYWPADASAHPVNAT